jgi:hypothetical protein
VRRLITFAAAVAFALAAAPAAQAQMADALGKPLPKADLPVGTVTVRVVEGDLAKPLVGADVELRVTGIAEVKTARTDASGRATFAGLAPGARVKATFAGQEKPIESEEITVPAEGGVAVMLSSVPFKDGGGGPMMGGGGMPEPRSMAGQPRPEQADPGGKITVRLSYNDLTKTDGIADRPVVFVKYTADDQVQAKVVRTDAAGRVDIDADNSGNAAYYALALLPRGDASDRLMSLPITPYPEVGVRVMLSGEKIDSGKPPVEDLEKFVRTAKLPAGQVIVAIGGDPPPDGEVELVDAVGGKVVAKAPLSRGRAVPGSVDATIADPTPTATAGAVELNVVVAAGQQKLGLPRAPVTVRTPEGAASPFLGTALTGQDGKAVVNGAPAGVPLEAVVTIQGQAFSSRPFTLEAGKGGALEVTAKFELLSLVEAAFEGVPESPEGAYYTQLRVGGEVFRSPPFMMAPDRGIVVPLFVIDRISVGFALDATFEDDFLAVRGSFLIQNASWAPWAGPSEGLRVPTPKGATGLVVADEDKPWVSADGDAFRLLRPVPPFGGDFRAGFSIPVEDGRVGWDLGLPMGTQGSSLAILRTKGMQVVAPKGARARDVKQPNGATWYAIQDITIRPNERMVFEISGLPQRPAWHMWSRRAAWIVVLLLLAGGIGFAVTRRPLVAPSDAATQRKARKKRIDALLDQIAAIDRGDGDAGKREVLVGELETLYREDAAA